MIQKGSQKAPQSGPKGSLEPSFFGAVFHSLFGTTFAGTPYRSGTSPSSAEALFFGHFSGPSFRTVPGGSPAPLFITFGSPFHPPGSLFGPFFVASSVPSSALPCAAHPPGLPTKTFQLLRSTLPTPPSQAPLPGSSPSAPPARFYLQAQTIFGGGRWSRSAGSITYPKTTENMRKRQETTEN